MGKEGEVRQFLKDFIQKLKIWGILYRDDRGKNQQTLLGLTNSNVICISFHIAEYPLTYPFKSQQP
ncbi:MAG: hypothetical protein M0Q51_13075 [Bacteroidales bacterium]|nr:hypothetical protein [Bacteroidales bacterium]